MILNEKFYKIIKVNILLQTFGHEAVGPAVRRSYHTSLSTVSVHSPTSAARAPTAASTGANTSPTTPIVSGKLISSLPSLS